MPDEMDRAQARAEQYQADMEAERRYRASRHTLSHTGACRYCGEALPGALRFCDVDCRDAWDHDQKRMRRVK